MPYTAQITRANPSLFVFVIDQSGSMGDPFAGAGGVGRSKAEELAITAKYEQQDRRIATALTFTGRKIANLQSEIAQRKCDLRQLFVPSFAQFLRQNL